MSMCKFSVITVCLNAESEIEQTIRSVLNQTYPDFEYLIKDGGSQDGTVSIAQSFAPAFAQRGIPYRVLSRRDSGVYDAMNQAACEARGEWINYMNAGDWFADGSVLERTAQSGLLETADVVYGDRILRNGDLFRYEKAYALEEFRFRLPFGHQSSFTRGELLRALPFSLKYRLCSDYHFFLQLYREGRRFACMPMAVAVYDIHGISSDWKKNHLDRLRILEEMPVRDDEAIRRLRARLKKKERQEWLYRHFFRYIPSQLRQKRRARMNAGAGWKTAEEMFPLGKDRP